MTVGPVSRNGATAEFFDAAADGWFLVKCCPDGHYNRPQAVACSECRTTALEPVRASGRARLVSWAVVTPRPPAPPVDPGRASPPADPGRVSPIAAPVVPAIVELEEGPWWWTSIATADPDRLYEGQPLEVSFERPEASEAVPVFRPAR